MAGLVPAIHDLLANALFRKTWMPGLSPGMTAEFRYSAWNEAVCGKCVLGLRDRFTRAIFDNAIREP